MSLLHNLLEKLNLKYEDLSAEERKTYQQWGEKLAELSLVENELLSFENTKEKDLFLKAQVRNLKMLNAFIQGPEHRRKLAQEQINKASK
jgi:hypothetical protein